jgi:hypothetical protein
MPARFYVTDLRGESTVTDRVTGQVVFTGPYSRALSQAAELNRQASGFYNPATTVVSSGTVVRDDQAAKVDKSNELNPAGGILTLENGRVTPAPDTSSSSNANKFNPATIGDFGTDDELRPYIQTQGTPLGPEQVSNGPTNPSTGRAIPSGRPGASARSDDAVGGNATVAELNLIDYGKITPQPNVLDQYSSYTYQASLYMMDDNSYQRMINTKQKNLNGAQLLIQSGGAPVIGRNEYFSLDYYIDSIELRSEIACKGVGLAHNVSSVRMTIVEPNGITLIQNLDSAAEKFLGNVSEKQQRFSTQIYLLVIRFYGYDDQGNLVRGGISKPDQTSDPNAFVEKWYPLQIENLTFKVANKAVEYQLSATAVPYYIGASSGRGSIPFNIELSGQTLKDVLAGPAVYAAGQSGGNQTAATAARTGVDLTNTSAGGGRGGTTSYQPPPNASASNTNKKTVRAGLMAALNEYQRDLVKQKIYEIPDEYEIEFVLDSLASAKVTSTSGLDKSATSMSTTGTAADQKLGSKQSMDPNSRVEGATAGMQIVQFIDTLLRNSSYIKDQQVVQINDATKKVEPTGVKTANTSWYKIGFEAIPKISQGIDKQRNDYAYKIKYTISPYKLSQLYSPYFNVPLPTGTHKQYRYWFTGQNDSVLDYTETFNYLYYSVLSGADYSDRSSNNVAYLKRQYQTASGQSSQGASGKTNEPGANAADQLYSPGDLGECEITIVGDPSWLQQGETAAGLRKTDPDYFKAFLADGTINFDSQQILFEVGFNAPDDYNLETGLIQPKWGVIDTDVQKYYNTRKEGLAQITRTYVATSVTSSFSRGKFTQIVKGTLMPYEQEVNMPEQTPSSAVVAAAAKTTAPKWSPKSERSSVTNPTPSSSLAKGTQQILNPPTQLNDPTLSQLQASPVYIQARRNGATPAAALAAAKASFAAGTNNASGTALPGIRTGLNYQQIVRDQ